ncbi:hypothetical protein HAX54_009184, partial [Datura stramonium]|nr:hypothetical protein [Datura stramonium]
PLRSSSSMLRSHREGLLEIGAHLHITSTWHEGHRGGPAPCHGPIAKALCPLSLFFQNLTLAHTSANFFCAR